MLHDFKFEINLQAPMIIIVQASNITANINESRREKTGLRCF